jgi:hypothetical protein
MRTSAIRPRSFPRIYEFRPSIPNLVGATNGRPYSTCNGTHLSINQNGRQTVVDLAPTLFFDRNQGTVYSSGREFADYLNQYLPTIGEHAVSIGMVLQNPEKSKHMETATLRDN